MYGGLMGFAILGLGPLELVIIILIIIVLFFPAILPKLIKRLSQSVSTIRQIADEEIGTDKKEKEEE